MLTKEQIVQAAVEVLDTEGVNGLNLRRLGAHLGSAPSAMYHHVKNKDKLVVLAADHVFGEIVMPDTPRVGWREAAASLARGAYAMVVRHFWLIPAMSTHLIYGPNKARFDERSLTVYESAGFTEDGADQAAATVLMFVIGAAQGEAAQAAWRAHLRRSGADTDKELQDVTAEILEIAQAFPRLRARISPAIAAPPGDPFEFGLHTLLAGLEWRLSRPHHDHGQGL
ncbi:TetR family transcriptional regulator [Acrocarpospora phusangensis]|uniref:TetR family transcriptional regulator n=1 Tax=Acrocarpospora phusangensis TaxID=1070424 RepID=A0A919UPF7_9ACTN|nr:TetR/AcrR family transcriptional regulator C-terminal domain-containing protein [Acrocarpospora phusangensis]GIH23585.1 TetR family transcriptional regulator [Acrocarpospora phusangensis]